MLFRARNSLILTRVRWHLEAAFTRLAPDVSPRAWWRRLRHTSGFGRVVFLTFGIGDLDQGLRRLTVFLQKLGEALGREGMHFNLETAVSKYLSDAATKRSDG